MGTESNSERHSAALLIAWRVVQVEPLSDLKLSVRFADGLSGVVDLARLVHGNHAGVFHMLRDPEFFAQVGLEHGAVSWPGGLDLEPDAMHDAIQRPTVWVV